MFFIMMFLSFIFFIKGGKKIRHNKKDKTKAIAPRKVIYPNTLKNVIFCANG